MEDEITIGTIDGAGKIELTPETQEILDKATIISDYMRSLGKKGGEKNKLKGREYFSKIGKIKHKRGGKHIKRQEKRDSDISS